MSSIYRSPALTLMLLLFIISIHFASHAFMVTRATAHVDRRPIGPPAFCKNISPSKVYTCVLNMVMTPICTMVATMVRSSRSVSSTLGNTQWSSLATGAVTPGLVPPLADLLGSTRYKGDRRCSVLVRFMAMYVLASL